MMDIWNFVRLDMRVLKFVAAEFFLSLCFVRDICSFVRPDMGVLELVARKLFQGSFLSWTFATF